MRFLLDTNIILRLANENDVEHGLVNEALEPVVAKGDKKSQKMRTRGVRFIGRECFMKPQDTNVAVDGKTVRINDFAWVAEHPIRDFAVLVDKVILIYDYVAMSKSRDQFKNMKAFDFTGKLLWTAEHPTDQPNDCYVNFASKEPLMALNFAGFECLINPADGVILEATFTK